MDITHTKLTEDDYVSFSLMNSLGYLTNAGVLLADQNIYRHNRIFCTRWNGLNKTSLEEASDDAEYSGSLVKLLDSALNFVKNNTKKKWKKEAHGRVEMPEYNDIAIREAIVNALIHRQYTNVGSEVTIDIYDDRIDITSPGPTASGVIINKNIENKIPSIRRNPIIADIFSRMNYMDRRGSGFDKIINWTNRLFNDGKNHVEFYATPTHFSVIIYNANYVNDKVNDKVSLSINAKNILEAIICKPSITRKELAKIIEKKESTVDRAIRELKNKGFIKEKKCDKNGEWQILRT